MRSRIFWRVYFSSVLLALPVIAGGLVGRWGAGLAVALTGGLFVARGLVRPLARVAEQAKAIADGDYGRRVPEGRRDEIGVLARSLNAMAGGLSQSARDREAIDDAFRKAQALEQKVEACSREQSSEEHYRDLVENANDIIFTTDLEGRFLSLNQAGERAIGYTKVEAMTMSLFDIVASEYRKLVRQLTGQMLTNRTGATYEIDIVTRGRPKSDD